MAALACCSASAGASTLRRGRKITGITVTATRTTKTFTDADVAAPYDQVNV